MRSPVDRRLQVIAAALWLPESFVTQPRVGSQRMEWKVLRPFRQIDFVNVVGSSSVSHQNFLSLGFFLGGPDSYPDQQTLRFRQLFQSPYALPPHPPAHQKHRSAAYNKPAQSRKDSDRERLHLLHDKVNRQGDRANATRDAASDNLGAKYIVFTRKGLSGSDRQIGKICGRN